MSGLRFHNVATCDGQQHHERQNDKNPADQIARPTQVIEAHQLAPEAGMFMIHVRVFPGRNRSRFGSAFAEIGRRQSELNRDGNQAEGNQIAYCYTKTCEVEDQVIDQFDLGRRCEDSEVHGVTHKLNKTRYKLRSNSTGLMSSIFLTDIGKRPLLCFLINGLMLILGLFQTLFFEKSKLTPSKYSMIEVASC